MALSIDQIIGEQENRRAVIGRIKTAYDIEILQSDQDNHVVFEIQKEEIQSVLQLTPCIAAMRRNPPVTGQDAFRVWRILSVSMDCIVWPPQEAYRKRIYETADVRCARVPESNEGAALPRGDGQNCLCSGFFSHFGFHYIYDRPRYELKQSRFLWKCCNVQQEVSLLFWRKRIVRLRWSGQESCSHWHILSMQSSVESMGCL